MADDQGQADDQADNVETDEARIDRVRQARNDRRGHAAVGDHPVAVARRARNERRSI